MHSDIKNYWKSKQPVACSSQVEWDSDIVLSTRRVETTHPAVMDYIGLMVDRKRNPKDEELIRKSRKARMELYVLMGIVRPTAVDLSTINPA